MSRLQHAAECHNYKGCQYIFYGHFTSFLYKDTVYWDTFGHAPNTWLMLILIAGLPATGKTVHARMLAAALNAQHLNSDRMREIMGLRGHYQPADKQAVYDALLEAGKEALQHGSKVVIDSTFYRESGRVPFREMAQSSGAPLFWITIRADETTIRKRLLIPRPDSEADWDVYTRLRDASEPLNDPHLELWSDRLTVEEMLLMSLLHLKNARV